MLDVLWVGLAGGLGGACRYLVDLRVVPRIIGGIPIGTLVVNVTGSLLFGLLTGLVLFHGAPTTVALVAGTGFCGGYTTFSAASFESVRHLREGRLSPGLLTAGGNLVGGLAAAGLGLALAAL